MSRKHNAKHPSRGPSRYHKRLEDRGLSRTPVMRDFVDAAKRRGSTNDNAQRPRRRH